MKWKKVMSGVLAGTLILTPVTPAAAAIEEIPVLVEESAEESSDQENVQDIEVEEEQVQETEAFVADEEGSEEEQSALATENGLVASYDFEGENPLTNAANSDESATALTTGLSSYSGKVVTEEGRTE